MQKLTTYVACIFLVLALGIKKTNAGPMKDESSNVGLAILDSNPLTYGKQILFQSKFLESDVELNIYLPQTFESSKHYQTFPVLFVNGSHGNQFFHQVTGIVRHLTSVDRMPDSIVVSLNYSGHFPNVYTNGMWRKSEINGYGQVDNYIKHLQQELFPFLEHRYRANDYRQIIGVSGSALFPLYALVNHPQLFQDYMFLASSDMVGMGFSQSATLYEEINNTLAKKIRAIGEQPGIVYFAEADDDIINDPEYQENFAKLKGGLQSIETPSKQLIIETLDNERHYDALLKGMLSFIEHVYPESIWAPKYRELIKAPGDALQNIEDYYQTLSSRYGFTVYPNADRWNSVNCLRFITQKLLKDNELEQALTMAKRWQFYMPNDVQAMLVTGKIHLAKRNKQQAQNVLEKALSIAKASKDYREKEIAELLQSIAS
ncbi:alpha/beta hydrolase-fold protein [Thalassotalea fusca]